MKFLYIILSLIILYFLYNHFVKKEHLHSFFIKEPHYPTMRDRLNYFKPQKIPYSESAAFGLRAVGWGTR